LYSASVEPGVIKLWSELRVPEANLGVRTEKLVVIDADLKDGGDESLAALEREHGELPLTWRVLTGGGGEHIIYAAPDGVEITSFAANTMANPPLGRGIDVRARGGYIVAPPSRHVSGRSYAWSVDHHPADVPLAFAPDWLITRLTAARGTASGADGGIPDPLPSDEWAKLTRTPVTQYHDMAAIKIIGHLLRHGCDYQLALGLMHAWNSGWCTPPIPYAELNHIVDRIARREAARRQADLEARRRQAEHDE
jgi:hypothetical protein